MKLSREEIVNVILAARDKEIMHVAERIVDAGYSAKTITVGTSEKDDGSTDVIYVDGVPVCVVDIVLTLDSDTCHATVATNWIGPAEGRDLN